MKLNRHFLIFLILIATLSCINAQTNNEREVRQLERAWLDAYEQRDVKAMAEIVADDFTITFTNGGIQTKPQIIKSLNAAREKSSASSKFRTEDVQARVHGDTVILTGRVISEWQQNGQAMKEQNRYTDTYVKRNGRWQVVASHLSDVPKPQNQNTQVSSNSAQTTVSDSDKAAIKATALDYIEGWYEGNAERMGRALHPELAKRIVRKDAQGNSRLDQMGAMALVQGVKHGFGKNTPKEKQIKEVAILDVYENTASVKAVMSDWIDYMHIARWSNRWVIVNVLWELKPESK